MKLVLLSLVTMMSLSANAQWNSGGRGGWGGDRGGWGNDRGGASGWQQVDEVHFRDGKTAVAIANCQRARQADNRCTRMNDYSCSPCSEIAHSDHSSYIVYQMSRGGNGPGRPGPGRPGPRPEPPQQRVFEQTFHFRDNKTAVAYQKCVNYISQLRQCQDQRNYDCTPCTQESHTDHSQFDLYKLTRRGW